MIGRVEDARLPAAQQRLDQLVDHGRLLVDDGQVQRTVERSPNHSLRFAPPLLRTTGELPDVSPLVSWTEHRCVWTASRTRVSPELQYWSRAAAVCWARWDVLWWRAVAGNRGHMMSVPVVGFRASS